MGRVRAGEALPDGRGRGTSVSRGGALRVERVLRSRALIPDWGLDNTVAYVYSGLVVCLHSVRLRPRFIHRSGLGLTACGRPGISFSGSFGRGNLVSSLRELSYA